MASDRQTGGGVWSGWTEGRGRRGWLVRSFEANRSNHHLARSNQSQSQRCCIINVRVDVESASPFLYRDLTTYYYLPTSTPALLSSRSSRESCRCLYVSLRDQSQTLRHHPQPPPTH